MSIVTVTHESSAVIRMWLASLGEITDDVELIIVDSGSRDYDELRAAVVGTKVCLVRQPRNVGYGAGNNIGAAIASGSWLAFVNPDVHVRVADLLEAARVAEQGHIACVGLELSDSNGAGRQSFSAFPRPPWIRRPERGSLAARDMNVTWTQTVPGCVMVMNHSAFNRVGGFDVSFFLFMEEIDLHLRLVRAGNRIAMLKGIPAVTDGGQSSGDVSKRWSDTERAVSHVRYYRKNFGVIAAALDFCVRLTLVLCDKRFRPRRASVRQLFAGRPLRIMSQSRRKLLLEASEAIEIERCPR